jgi:hypothetical protein
LALDSRSLFAVSPELHPAMAGAPAAASVRRAAKTAAFMSWLLVTFSPDRMECGRIFGGTGERRFP